MRKNIMNNDAKRITSAVLALVLVLAILAIGSKIVDKKSAVDVSEEDELNRNIETFLIIGIDDFSDQKETYDSYNNTMQADYLVLLMFNTRTNEVSALHINRDTMTPITILGVLGDKVGKETHQIALSHTYGTGEKDSCLNTVTAVEDLLGIVIDHYARITMDAIPLLNDAIGGVTLTPTVTIQTDTENTETTNNLITEGQTVTLTGDQALAYVRVRQSVSDGSNLKRMERQRQYMSAFIEQVKANKDNIDTETLFKDISDKIVSDCSIERLETIFDKSADFTFTEIYTLEGTAKVGDSGYMEYHLDQDKLNETIKDLFYK